MAKQASHGEARFKVRRNILLLDRFTIARLVQATGLNPESVRTEVQRMKQEGFVVSDAGSGRRGAQYRLSDDPEKRLALSRSLEAFYLERPQPAQQRPTSRLFKVAVQCLDQTEKETGEKREKLLEQAAHWLEGAWQAEGADRAPESVQAYIMCEQGRLAYLGGHREPAQELFQKAKKVFGALDLQSEVRLIDEYLAYIAARRRMEVESATDAAGLARCVLSTLQTMDVALSPLVRLLADLVQSLSRSGEQTLGYVDGAAGLIPARGESLALVSASRTRNLVVPIKLRGEPIGVLEFSDEDASRAWSEDEQALVEVLADQAALALENARLFEETQSRARREQLINEITARVRASTDIETTLRTAAEELAKTMNLPRAHIRLSAGDSNKTTIALDKDRD